MCMHLQNNGNLFRCSGIFQCKPKKKITSRWLWYSDFDLEFEIQKLLEMTIGKQGTLFCRILLALMGRSLQSTSWMAGRGGGSHASQYSV